MSNRALPRTHLYCDRNAASLMVSLEKTDVFSGVLQCFY